MKNWRDSYRQYANLSEKFNFMVTLLEQIKTKSEANEFLKTYNGGVSNPSKMPCFSYSIPAWECKKGSELAKIKGSTCYNCYAMKGMYTFSNVKKALYTRFEKISQLFWLESMVLTIAINEKTNFFRWHDSGDLQSVEHLANIVKIAELMPNINFWLPTREYKIVSDFEGIIPQNLCIRFSSHMNNSYKEIRNKKNASVVIDNENLSQSGNVCHATLHDSDGKCGDCRKCWNTEIEIIEYIKH
jgi:hypothetical protein